MKKIKKIKAEPGVCPKCGADDLNYGDATIDDGQLGYKCWCSSCGFDGTEWYELKFVCFHDNKTDKDIMKR